MHRSLRRTSGSVGEADFCLCGSIVSASWRKLHPFGLNRVFAASLSTTSPLLLWPIPTSSKLFWGHGLMRPVRFQTHLHRERGFQPGTQRSADRSSVDHCIEKALGVSHLEVLFGIENNRLSFVRREG